MAAARPNAALRTVSLALAAALLGASAAVPASASPDVPSRAATRSEKVVVRVGPARVSVDTANSAIPVGGTFVYPVTARANAPVEFLQVRMRLLMPRTRKLIYQKTFVKSLAKGTVESFRFEREIGDIGLEPGAYPVEVSVRVADGGDSSEDVVNASLIVYDATKPPLEVVPVIRVSAVPMTGPDGGLTSDPARFTRARDDVDALCRYVLAGQDARLTLALSPIMLEDWRRIASGYRYEGPEGTVEVTGEAPVAQAYGAVLRRLKAATATGRLELITLGYSDPNLAELAGAKLLDDITAQYELGASTFFAAIETTPSPGTATSGGSVSEVAGARLVAQDLDYVVVKSKWARLGTDSAPAGVFRARTSPLRVLVSDDSAVRTVLSSSTPEALARIFEQHVGTTGAPLPLLLAVGPDAASATDVVALATAIERQPWAALSIARDVAASEQPARIDLVGAPADRKAPAGHWAAVAEARRLADALSFTLGADTDEALSAQRDSMAAEGSAWAGTRSRWGLAEQSLAYSANVERTAETLLKKVSMSAKAVTLAGTQGDVPITITNKSGRPLRVTLITEPLMDVRLESSRTRQLVLQPQENFVEIPVDLGGTYSGSLRVRLRAADVEITQTTVALKASFIDRVVILAGIVVVLVGLLAFIIAKVRAAESGDESAGRGGRRYT